MLAALAAAGMAVANVKPVLQGYDVRSPPYVLPPRSRPNNLLTCVLFVALLCTLLQVVAYFSLDANDKGVKGSDKFATTLLTTDLSDAETPMADTNWTFWYVLHPGPQQTWSSCSHVQQSGNVVYLSSGTTMHHTVVVGCLSTGSRQKKT